MTQYLLDTQPGLALVLRETTPSQTTHYTHGSMGVHAIQQDSAWVIPLIDGLGSVRVQVDTLGQVTASKQYDPYGQWYDEVGNWIGSFAFTGEQRDANGLQYHRARYYKPSLGAWTSQDSLETPNRYGYVSGNPVDQVDPTGMFNWCSGSFEPNDTVGDVVRQGCPDWETFNSTLEIMRSYDPLHPLATSRPLGLNTPIKDMPNSQLWVPLNIRPDIKAVGQIRSRQQCQQAQDVLNYPINTSVAGYIEGMSAAVSLGHTQGVITEVVAQEALSKGEEMVYNFATFERVKFNYTIRALDNNQIGISAGPYIGAVLSGFESSAYGSPPYEKFVSQYSGATYFGTLGTGRGFEIFGASVSLGPNALVFASATNFSLYGFTVGFSGSAAYSRPIETRFGDFGGAFGIGDYTPDFSYAKSYIRDCQVDVHELAADILAGTGSPFASLSNIEFLGGYLVGQIASVGLFAGSFPLRLAAAIAGRRFGDLYNDRNRGSCQTSKLNSTC